MIRENIFHSTCFGPPSGSESKAPRSWKWRIHTLVVGRRKECFFPPATRMPFQDVAQQERPIDPQDIKHSGPWVSLVVQRKTKWIWLPSHDKVVAISLYQSDEVQKVFFHTTYVSDTTYVSAIQGSTLFCGFFSHEDAPTDLITDADPPNEEIVQNQHFTLSFRTRLVKVNASNNHVRSWLIFYCACAIESTCSA